MLATAVPVSVLEEAFEFEKCCECRVTNMKSGQVVSTCASPAAWVHVHRCCGWVRLVCEWHHRDWNPSRVLLCRGCQRKFDYLGDMVCASYKV